MVNQTIRRRLHFENTLLKSLKYGSRSFIVGQVFLSFRINTSGVGVNITVDHVERRQVDNEAVLKHKYLTIIEIAHAYVCICVRACVRV